MPTVVVAHPRHERAALAQASLVSAEAISWDTGMLGRTRNHLQAWKYLTEAGVPGGRIVDGTIDYTLPRSILEGWERARQDAGWTFRKLRDHRLGRFNPAGFVELSIEEVLAMRGVRYA